MPPPPLLKSERSQKFAVAVLMGVFFLCATGLAYLQAGEGDAFINAPRRQIQRLSEPDSGQADARQTMLIDTPADWQTQTDEPGRLVATDPHRPSRSITLLSIRMPTRATPDQALEQYIHAHLPPASLRTLDAAIEPSAFKLAEQDVVGAQFIGTSHETTADGQQTTRLHLIACLTRDGYTYGTIYLADTVGPEDDELNALRSNHRLLSNLCRSVRIEDE